MDFKYCQRELGFDITNENWALILSMRIGLWCCQWKLGFKYWQRELGFDIANENWVLNITSENWALILPMRIGFWCCQWKLRFSNIVKHKYSWALNRIGCVHWVHRVSFGFSQIMIIKLNKIWVFGLFVIVYIMIQFR